MILAALTLLSFIFTTKVPGIPARISVSETFVFTSVLFFGTAAATVTVALDALVMSAWSQRHKPIRVFFNAAEPALSIWVASQLFFMLIGAPVTERPQSVNNLLLPVLVLSLTYFLLNSVLTAIAIKLERGGRVFEIWRTHFLWLALNYLGGASVALLIVQNSNTVSVATIGIILPLLFITYLTFKSSMGRIDDANRNVERVNQMYLSTIETLAMAVDAKDQTTHGHIRRVQNHAVALAKALGMADDDSIRSIEAAALLHDIGKLGIPEHILNKPGKLNALEFEQMKTHAAMGADILSATDFPYPVVPIVRHHHENWDGTGYPDGLSGVDIPIGARLLAVVDCHDALTSDRPYRQRMPRQQALDILIERRGSMYDPLIVDAFISLVEQELIDSEPEQHPLSPGPDLEALRQGESLQRSAATCLDRDEPGSVRALYSSAASQVLCDLPLLVPDSVFVVYRLDETGKHLVVVCASKEAEVIVAGLKISVARQLSGWVAANWKTIANSDPCLDSPELSRALSLRYAICTPISSGIVLFGVLAVYRRSDTAFSGKETDTVESLSRAVAEMLTKRSSSSRELAER